MSWGQRFDRSSFPLFCRPWHLLWLHYGHFLMKSSTVASALVLQLQERGAATNSMSNAHLVLSWEFYVSIPAVSNINIDTSENIYTIYRQWQWWYKKLAGDFRWSKKNSRKMANGWTFKQELKIIACKTPLLQTAPLLFPTEGSHRSLSKAFSSQGCAAISFSEVNGIPLPSVVLVVLQIPAVSKKFAIFKHGQNPKNVKLWWLSGRANRRPKSYTSHSSLKSAIRSDLETG